MLAGGPIITEFVAANVASLTDGFGDSPDWIEVHNPTDRPIVLHDYFLSDNSASPHKWQFPERVALGPGQYLVVFASGRDLVDDRGRLHTNFRLDSDGEYLALSNRAGEVFSVFDQDRGTFPLAVRDIGFGWAAGGADGVAELGYLSPATPGQPNPPVALRELLPSPVYSHEGGA
jgi:hypothetical protein